MLNGINKTLWKFCDRLTVSLCFYLFFQHTNIYTVFFQHTNETYVSEHPDNLEDPQALLEQLTEKMNALIDFIGGKEKYLAWIDETMTDNNETLSIGSKSDVEKVTVVDDKPLFPPFPGAPTPAGQLILSEDEDEVPTRSVLKRQAQLLVDTKSRRKGFNFRR